MSHRVVKFAAACAVACAAAVAFSDVTVKVLFGGDKAPLDAAGFTNVVALANGKGYVPCNYTAFGASPSATNETRGVVSSVIAMTANYIGADGNVVYVYNDAAKTNAVGVLFQ